MLLRFARDLSCDPDMSKYDLLAISCAKYMRGEAKFGPPVPGCVPVIQCGCGKVISPAVDIDDCKKYRCVAIFHDWDDRYGDIADIACRRVCIGFEMPGMTTVDTFPLEGNDLVKVPKMPGMAFSGGIRLNAARISRIMLSFHYRTAEHIDHFGDGNGTGYLGALAAYHCDSVNYANGGRPSRITTMDKFLPIIIS